MKRPDIVLSPEQANALERFRRETTIEIPVELDTFEIAVLSKALLDGYWIGTPDQPPVFKPNTLPNPAERSV